MRYSLCFIACVLLVLVCSKAQSEEQIIWSSSVREGVKVGVMTRRYPNSPTCYIEVLVAQTASYSNNLVRPEPYQALAISLTDPSGKAVPLTSEGKKYGAKLPTRMRSIERSRRGLGWLKGDSDPLNPYYFKDDCFVVREHGDYLLHVRVTLLKEAPSRLVPAGTLNGTNTAYARVYDGQPDEVRPVEFEPIDLKLYLRSNAEQK